MKRLGAIWPQIISFENLYQAYLKARKGKSQSKEVAEFSLHLERKLLRLQWQLEQGIYQPGDYRFFTLYERKPRLIAAAPFVDRVVHHALLNIIEPVIDRQFIYDSYACRKGKGVHAAVDRYQNWAKQYRYALKMDIAFLCFEMSRFEFIRIYVDTLVLLATHLRRDSMVVLAFSLLFFYRRGNPLWLPG